MILTGDPFCQAATCRFGSKFATKFVWALLKIWEPALTVRL